MHCRSVHVSHPTHVIMAPFHETSSLLTSSMTGRLSTLCCCSSCAQSTGKRGAVSNQAAQAMVTKSMPCRGSAHLQGGANAAVLLQHLRTANAHRGHQESASPCRCAHDSRRRAPIGQRRSHRHGRLRCVHDCAAPAAHHEGRLVGRKESLEAGALKERLDPIEEHCVAGEGAEQG